MRSATSIKTIEQPIYDTVQLTASAAQLATFFSVAQGGVMAGAVTKTYEHTNMIQTGRLEKGVEMLITGISLNVKEAATGGAVVTWADYLNVYESYLRLKIGDTYFLSIPTILVPPASAETNYFSNIAAAATEFKATKGIGSINNKFSLEKQPLLLEEQETLQVELKLSSTIVAVTDVMIVLWGVTTTPVR